MWGARHAAGLDGKKLVVLEPLGVPGDGDGGSASGDGSHSGDADVATAARGLLGRGGRVIAVDGLGAGPGELVLVAHGSRVRDLTVGAEVCDKDIVIAIVDDLELAR